MLILAIVSQILMLATVIFIVSVKHIIQVVILSGISSTISVLFYSILHAPDIAITEAVIGVAVGTILFIFSYLYMKQFRNIEVDTVEIENVRKKIFVFIVGSLFFVVFVYIILRLPSDILAQDKYNEMATFYVNNAHKDFSIESIVTAIVAGYRAFDTLFECVVTFIASLGFKAILSDDNI